MTPTDVFVLQNLGYLTFFKSAPVKSVSVNLAPLKLEGLRLAPLELTPHTLASDKSQLSQLFSNLNISKSSYLNPKAGAVSKAVARTEQIISS